MTYLVRVVVSLLLVLGIFPALARDLAKTDPVRLALLDSIRDEPERRFVVRDLFVAGNFAWMCGLKADKQGRIEGTDDALDLYQWVFVRDQGRWLGWRSGGSFSKTVASADCRAEQGSRLASSNGVPGTEADIKLIWAETLKRDLSNNLREPPLAPALLIALKAQGALVDFSIEIAKDKYDASQISISSQQCKSDVKCVAAVKKSYAHLAQLGANPALSSLLWEHCKYGLRMFDPGLIEQCLVSQMKNPYCRPNLHYFKDGDDIKSCLQDIRKNCLNELAGAKERDAICH